MDEKKTAPAPDPYIPFGVHSGKYASQVDVGYLDWLIGQSWVRVNLKQQILEHLRTRAEWKRL